MDNLNLLYNKLYYDAVHKPKSDFEQHIKNCNEHLFAATFADDPCHAALMDQLAPHRFILRTVYPGLLIGLGAVHSAGLVTDELVLGFSFDYVTGLPYIPGSTVKGVLRSFLKNQPEVAAEVIGIDPQAVKALENDIFNGNDIFFDAMVYDSDEYGRLIGPEYITPHSSPTDNPVPVAMVKVLPGVRFKFRFKLHDSAGMKAEDKQALFAHLLCVMGIGAKTNVGFGIMQPDVTNGAVQKKKVLTASSTAKQRQDSKNGGKTAAVPANSDSHKSKREKKNGKL